MASAFYRVQKDTRQDRICEITGQDIVSGRYFWKSIGNLPAMCYLLTERPADLNKFKARAALSKYAVKVLKGMVFDYNLHADSSRTLIHEASKPALVSLLLGESVTLNKWRPKGAIESVAGMTAEQLQKMIDAAVAERLASMTPTQVVLPSAPKKPKDVGVQHKQFAGLLKMLSLGLNVYLVGPAGTGKTRAAAECAKALGKDFYSESVSWQTPESRLKGYMSATGDYVSSIMRDCFEEGGVFLLDEMDAGNPNVITAFNAAAAAEAGEMVAFPDGMVKKHQDCIFIAAANTIGRGADRQYVGRNPLDAASLDRFAFLEWDYDAHFETAITLSMGLDKTWVRYCQAARDAMAELEIRHVVSIRAMIVGGKMLGAKLKWAAAEYSALYKGLKEEDCERVRSWVRSNVRGLLRE